MIMRVLRALLLTLPALLFVILPSANAATDFIVNSNGDLPDVSPGDGVCLTDAGNCTLSAAIEEANSTGDTDRILFDLVTGFRTISPLSKLPTITQPVIIDGTSQPGFTGTPLIELDGSLVGTDYIVGLNITGPGTTVRGLAINRFPAEGILIEGPAATGNIIQGNHVGTDISGTADLGNALTGIYIRYASGNLVEDNLISGNDGWTGVDACGNSAFCGGGFMGTLTTGAADNVIRNNKIGTDVSGSLALGNSQRGVLLDGAASNRVELNVVSANAMYGIGMLGIEATANVVVGNRVGVGVLGSEVLGNGSMGIVVADGAHDNQITDGNIVAHNADYGVVIDGATTFGNAIRRNSIYSNALGGIALRNGANNNITSPVLNTFTLGWVSGTACAGCEVDVFSDAANEGQFYMGTVTADLSTGFWSLSTFVPGPSVTATATDAVGNTSAFSEAFPIPMLSGLSISVDETNIGAGAKVVPLKDIPVDAIPALQALVSSTPLGSIRLADSPLGSIPLGSIPLGSIDIDGVPLGSIPLGSIPLGSIAGGWEALLNSPGCQALPACAALANNPTQALTLQDILALNPPPPEIAALTLGDVGLSETSLGSLSMASLLIGSAPLGSIPLGSIPLGSIPLGSIDIWGNPLGSIPLGSIDPPGGPLTMCDFLSSYPGFTCAELGLGDGDTLIVLFDAVLASGSSLGSSPLGSIFMDSLPLGSIDLAQVPLGSIPLGSIPLGSIPLGSIPLGSIPLGSIPLGSIPLGSIPLGSIPLGSIPLGSIGTASSPLGSIPLGSIPVPGSSDYCAFAAADPLFSCAALGIDTTDSLSEVVGAIVAAGGTVSSSPLGSIPLSSIPLGSIPLGSIPLGSIPLGSIPLGSIPLGSIAVQGNPLGSIPLGSIDPTGAPATMCDFLSAYPGFTCADLGVTNADTLASLFSAILGSGSSLSASPLTSVFMDSLPLGSIDFFQVPLGSIPLGSIPLGSITLSQINIGSTPLGSIPLGSINLPGGFTGFCSFAQSFGSQFGCSALAVNEGNTIQQYIDALTANGLALAASPLGSIPLGSIPLGSIPLGSIPLGSIPLGSIRIGGVPLGSILLTNINMAATPLGSIPLGSIPNVAAVVNCALVDCVTGTLADADAAGAILTSATIAGLSAAAGTFTLADVLSGVGASIDDVELMLSFFYGGGLLGDPGLDFGDLTLGQILIALLIQSDFSWEDLPLDQMAVQRFAGTGEALHYHVSLSNAGAGPADGTKIEVVLPEGFLYVPGSAQADSSILGPRKMGEPQVDAETNAHRWDIDLLGGETLQIDFSVFPGLRLGTFTASASASHPVGGTLLVSNQAPTTVGERFEDDNDSPADAPLIAPDTLVVSHITSATDDDFYRVAVPPPGSRVSVFLSHLSNDDDLVMYRPGTAPVSAAPPRPAPLGSIPLEDQGLDVQNSSDPLPPETLQDINLQSLPLGSISANRSSEDEIVSASAGSESGFYTIQVSGYNGQFSDEAYVLRVKVSPPPPAPQCSSRTFPFAGQGVPGSVPGSISGDRKSLILVNYDRFGDMYGAAALSALQSSLNNPAFLEHPNVKGAIIPVEGVPAIANDYAAWDANPCSPDLANAVVFGITQLIQNLTDPNNDGVLDANPQNVTIIGSDEIIPFGRTADVTKLSNEASYAQDMLLTAPGNNATFGSLFTSNVLSDNPYGDVDPIDWLGRHLFVPERAVGRLVEAPSEITGAINMFVQYNGNLDPRTLEAGRSASDARRSLTSGYDFLADGATTIDGIFNMITSANNQALINETWTAGDLESAMNPASGFAPDLISPNAHYDHFRALPANENALKTQKDLFTTANVEAFPPDRIQGRAILTMGCHSGLNAPDVIVANPTPDQQTRLLDWPQEYARRNAVYAGQTGYGYGDTATVALSERLMGLMAARLDGSMTVGQALSFAKQEYFAQMGVYGVYDEKVLHEATYYGLPMYTLPGSPQPVPPVAPPSLSTDPATGLQTATISSTPVFQLVDGQFGDFYAVQGQLPQVTHYRPIQPRTEFDITQPGAAARGALITSLSSVDEAGFDVAFARPVIDLTKNEPPPEFGDVAFPSSLQNVATYSSPAGTAQRLVLMTGQFFRTPDGTPVQRRFTQMTATVYYSNSSDFTPPNIDSVGGSVIGSAAAFAVDAHATVGEVVRVLVMYRDESGAWKSVDLERTPNTDHWTGGAPVVGSQVEYFVQALKSSGTVATSSNKGVYFEAAPPPPPPAGITVSVTGPQGNNSWFTGAAEVTIDAAAGLIIEVSTDGAPFAQQSGSFAVSGDGIHTVLYRASDGSEGLVVVPIDATPPQITINQPPQGASLTFGAFIPADYFCEDRGSGVSSCAGSVANGSPLPTGAVGTQSLTVTALDVAGNTSSLTHTFSVVPYSFDGFFSPLNNPPVFNLAVAGQGIPVKWRLRDASGALITDLTTVDSFTSSRIACDSSAVTDTVETASTGASGLRYDPTTQQFIYNWATAKNWARTCRQMVLTLDDGTQHIAYFRFK